jgi:hypothetical protein
VAIEFRKATKQQSRLRMAITGPTGSGKTYTALNIAKCLGGRVAVIDTENGSASLYSDDFDFDVMELVDSFHPANYVAAIKAAAAAGYDVCIVDSLTHAWTGKGGVLEIASGKFTGWKDARPAHEQLVNCLVSMRQRMHVIATMRSAMEHVQETDERTGKQVVRKIGMEAKQDKDMSYEFDVQGEMDHQHMMTIGKTRCKALDGKSFYHPGKDVADIVKDWLHELPYDPKPAIAAIGALPNCTAADKKRAQELKTRDEHLALHTEIKNRQAA